MFDSYASEDKVELEEEPLPDDTAVLLGWKCGIGKFKGKTWGYLVSHHEPEIRKLLKWSKLEERTREIIIRVLDAYHEWRQEQAASK